MNKTFLKILEFTLNASLPIIGAVSCLRSVSVQDNFNKYNCSSLEHELFGSIPALSEADLDLSIIVPVYNSERFLRRCLQSLEKQKTHYSYEVILVNDGSTDSSLSIAQEFASKNVGFRVITQCNQGISAARNTGIINSKGKYIGFVDNDDFVTEDYCETLLNHAFQEDADIVKCGHVRYDVLKNKEISIITQDSAKIQGEIGERIVDYKGFVWGGVYSRRLFKDIRFPVGFWYEDMIGRVLLMRKSRSFVFEQKPLYYYALHENNASKKLWSKSNLKALDQLKLAELLSLYGEQIGLGKSNGLYQVLLAELGPILWMRTRGFESKIIKRSFEEASTFIQSYKLPMKDKTLYEVYIERAFQQESFILWKIVSLAYMCNVKIQND